MCVCALVSVCTDVFHCEHPHVEKRKSKPEEACR